MVLSVGTRNPVQIEVVQGKHTLCLRLLVSYALYEVYG